MTVVEFHRLRGDIRLIGSDSIAEGPDSLRREQTNGRRRALQRVFGGYPRQRRCRTSAGARRVLRDVLVALAGGSMRRMMTDARTPHVLLCDAVLQAEEEEKMKTIAHKVLKNWTIASMVCASVVAPPCLSARLTCCCPRVGRLLT